MLWKIRLKDGIKASYLLLREGLESEGSLRVYSAVLYRALTILFLAQHF